MHNVGTVDDIECFAHVMIGNQHADTSVYVVVHLFSFVAIVIDGNRYCATCGPTAALDAKHRASKRYQNSAKGRRAHAERQKRYLAKKREKVTHRGSSAISIRDLMLPLKNQAGKTTEKSSKPDFTEIHCHCCQKLCLPFSRHNHFHSSA